MTLRMATRRSRLALAQSRWCADRITAETGEHVEVVEVVTEGDTNRASLQAIGGTGVFAAAVRYAVLEGRADFAVHSAKDLPTEPMQGLHIAAVPTREDPRDVIVARGNASLEMLGAGARVGTGSPRRAAQLEAMGLGLEIVDIRGNVDTRLAYVANGELDAVILARAGLNRLGLADKATQFLDLQQMLPAAGQGFLALECRAEDSAVAESVGSINDPSARTCLDAERELLAQLEMGCSAPIAAHSVMVNGEEGAQLRLEARLAIDDGKDVLTRSALGKISSPKTLGAELAATLIADAGANLPNR